MPLEPMYFTNVAHLGGGETAACGFLFDWEYDEPRGRLVRLRDGAWERVGDLPEYSRGLAVTDEDGSPVLYLILRDGVLHRFDETGQNASVIEDERNMAFQGLQEVSGSLFAYGMGKQLFKRTGSDWVSMDHGLFDGRPESCITSVAGGQGNELFAVGKGGIIHHFLKHIGQSAGI